MMDRGGHGMSGPSLAEALQEVARMERSYQDSADGDRANPGSCVPMGVTVATEKSAAALRVVLDAARAWRERVGDPPSVLDKMLADLALLDEARRSGVLTTLADHMEGYGELRLSPEEQDQCIDVLLRLAASTEQEGTNDARDSHK